MRKLRWKLLKTSKCSKRRIEQVVVMTMKGEFLIHPVRPRRFTPTFLRGHPHAPIPYEDFAQATGPETTFSALMEEAEQNDSRTHHHLEVHRMFHDVAEAFSEDQVKLGRLSQLTLELATAQQKLAQRLNYQ
jgi:hypothetical protein